MEENLKIPINLKDYPFTPIPHFILELLLYCEELDQNCIKVLLLIVRLTYGVDLKKKRRGRWADIKKSEFTVCGISPSHIDRSLDKLKKLELILHKAPNYYALNLISFESYTFNFEYMKTLDILLSLHLGQTKADPNISSDRLIQLSSQNGIFLEED